MKKDILTRFEAYRERFNESKKGLRAYWQIDGVFEYFRTLKDAKNYIYAAYADNERQRLDGCSITHRTDKNMISKVRISVKKGAVKYSRPEK